MFYLKKIRVLLAEERAWPALLALGETLRVQGIAMERAAAAGSVVLAEHGDGILWITDSPEYARDLMARELPLLIYLHPWNASESFPMAGFAMREPQDLDAEYLEQVYRRFAGIPWHILTTRRCVVREMCIQDAPELEAIYAHPAIRGTVGDLYRAETRQTKGFGKFPDSMEVCRKYLEDYIRQVYPLYQYGIWIIVERETSRVIGRAGFRHLEGELPDLGYLVAVPYQRQGYAWEVCTGILAYAGDVLGFRRVQARVAPDNTPSLSLCQKLGFRRAGEVVEDGMTYLRFEKTLA